MPNSHLTQQNLTIETEIARIALNEDADNFYEFHQGELEECIASDSVFICPATFLLKKIRQTPSCDVEILLNKSIKPNKCKIKIMELQDTYWKALTTPGNWIYSTTEKEIVRLNCRHTTKQFEINNSGIISVQQGCKIRARMATMSHPAYQTTTFAQHFVPTNNLSILELYKPKGNIKLISQKKLRMKFG
ncbi:hypothetical protein P5V15_012886 [Pogonomyrmex californicus]